MILLFLDVNRVGVVVVLNFVVNITLIVGWQQQREVSTFHRHPQELLYSKFTTTVGRRRIRHDVLCFPTQSMQPSSLSSSTSLFSSITPPSSSSSSSSLTHSLMNIEESTPRDFGNFEEWATTCGVQRSEGLQLTSHQDGFDLNVGVMTTEDIPINQPVLYVPYQMVWTGSKAREEIGPILEIEDELAVGRLHETLPQFYLFIQLLQQYELGQDSPWYPWLQSLPRYFSNGSSMTYLCTDLLPPLVGKLANQEQVRFRQFYDGLEYVSDSIVSPQTKANKAAAKWAFAIICTRSLPYGGDASGGDFHITPMVDMFNHDSAGPEIQIQFDDYGNCYAMSTRDLAAGSPLRISYTSDPTNPSFLFARYGFVDESASATFCKIMISNPRQQLVDMGYAHNRMLFFKNTGCVSAEVWDVLLYRLLGDTDKQGQQLFYDAHKTGDYETKQSIHQKYYSQTLEALVQHIDEFLTDLEELAELANNRDLNIHPRLPLIQKHNEFVKQTFETVKQRLLLGQ